MAETSFDAIPQDLQMKILSRKSLKFLGKCICASKKLASIICTKHFRDSYLLRSMTRPRMLFIVPLFSYLNFNPTENDVSFYSVYQDEKPFLSSGQQESRILHISQDPEYKISQPLRGLIYIREETKIVICNPTTKKFRTLPEAKTCKKKIIADYFGYDKGTDALKVLCVMQMKSDGQSKGANEYQVLTVGSVQESWRTITYEHDHTPVTEGLCKGGVLYYGARFTNDKSMVMMCFNVSSEKFTDVKLPDEVHFGCSWKIVNYKGEIALMDENDSDLRRNGVLQLWVRKENEGEWKKTRIEILRWEETVGRKEISFKGTIGTGELVFVLDYLDNRNPPKKKGSVVVLCYDTVTEKLRRFKTEKEFESAVQIQTFLDHVDSLDLCED